MYYSWWTMVFPIITVFCLLLFFRYYRVCSLPAAGTTEWITRLLEPKELRFGLHRYKLSKSDIIPMAVIALISVFLAYFVLGDTVAPQSFHRFTDDKTTVEIELDESTELSNIMYYSGLWTGYYNIWLSPDGETWTEQIAEEEGDHAMNQPHSDLYKWLYVELSGGTENVKYIRLTASRRPIELGEIALYDGAGELITPERIKSPDAPELFDEQELIPERPEYMNSMYFDEIYHGRTAYETILNVKPYENSHPPLGKIILSLGIRLFGMTPFGWRFMGATFGWIMLLLLYVFLKNMFGKTAVATCGTLLFTFDFMRYTQTRIATIDTYGVFFILLTYFFMYRYMTQPYDTKFRKTLLPLALSGLFFGIGCASKWIVIYAGAGLALLYVIHQVLKGRYYLANKREGFGRYLVGTLLFSVLFFVVIPVIVYCLSYIPYARSEGMSVGGGMLWSKEFYKLIWDNQVFMFTYHSGLTATHSYGSVWWQWILDGRPILYYRSYLPNDYKSAFAAFGNPVVWWGGLIAMIAMAVRVVKYRDERALFILVGYLIQLIPWIIISRVVFIYHYFPCVLFMVMALAHVMNTIIERKHGRYKLAVYGFTAAAIFLFIMFYPATTGVAAPGWYMKYILRWIPPAWPF